MKGYQIVEMKTEHEIRSVFPVMHELRPHLHEQEYVELVKEAVSVDRYRLYGLWNNGTLVAVTGFKPMTTLYYGRFVWVCDLVTTSTERSSGWGSILLQFIEKWGERNGFASVALFSGLERERAHKFYEEHKQYEKVSVVFRKQLDT
ncbi:GNAT family N-acetyltransferase [Halobacillus litoralis]|uniref:GNAT family N-acetyltransferase n=1 Tax=Halobacillus litoralis TaxID=45668 RepID=UPI001CD5DA61|nr:GNAT family N-acetyltransferase [Halobacillus litoralis]MCA1022841.1 GNAT family N-acetyltransferase [Halobacillus litoralis]